jgi:hypothetical protein
MYGRIFISMIKKHRSKYLGYKWAYYYLSEIRDAHEIYWLRDFFLRIFCNRKRGKETN